MGVGVSLQDKADIARLTIFSLVGGIVGFWALIVVSFYFHFREPRNLASTPEQVTGGKK